MKKILLVDDSETILLMSQRILGSLSYQTITAKNGKEGLSTFMAENPDLIITDYNMPQMDGYSFLEEIRKINKDIPVVFLTTEFEDALQKKAMSIGANGWLRKPMRPDILIGYVKNILN